MTTIKVSRKKIIDAIKSEPLETLKAGSFVHFKGSGGRAKVNNADCSVCAVGAVMRQVLDSKQPATKIDHASYAALKGHSAIDEDETECLNKGLYIAALSSFFEREYREYMLDVFSDATNEVEDGEYINGATLDKKIMTAKRKIRAETIQFVKKNFPEDIFIEIDGAKPAKDVQVIR